MQDYSSRLRIQLLGDSNTEFRCAKHQLLAMGYTRVVIGERGPYVELDEGHVNTEAFYESKVPHRYFVELRSSYSQVMLYYQLEPVGYADYRPGFFYLSPFELYVGGKQVIEPLSR